MQKIARRTVNALCALIFGTTTCMLTNCVSNVSAATNVKKIYLTFDDGPDAVYTPLILDILHKEHVKATFFVLGYRSQQSPYIIRRIHNDGHEIGNHGFYHTYIAHKSKQWVERDISRTDAAIEAICGVKPKYFRPPGGILSESDGALVRKAGHPIAMWTLDTNDWKGKPASSIISIVKREARPNAIILMHDGVPSSRNTVQALPSVIRYLRSNGYTFAMLPEQYQGEYIGRKTDTTNYRLR
ncbi:polysaccharide deacetylase family protein [Alicyclobacillus fodiniaquatilis]|uniref:Polysaccharide deacetylase family protein n=1 Tax=Alicyclobacillus fodiniaquatilis TaxID=1661150 RepID=A0ABW4JKT9_9BACL